MNQNGNDVVSDPAARNGHGRPGPEPHSRARPRPTTTRTLTQICSAPICSIRARCSSAATSPAALAAGTASRTAHPARPRPAWQRRAPRSPMRSTRPRGGLRRRRPGSPVQPPPAGSGVPGGITAAEAFRPAMPLQPRPVQPRAGAGRPRPRRDRPADLFPGLGRLVTGTGPASGDDAPQRRARCRGAGQLQYGSRAALSQ